MSRPGPIWLASVTLPLTLLACVGEDPIGRPDGAARGLDRCGDDGLALAPLWQVDNLHGEITAMTTAPDGTVVLATADGAVKQWSLGVSAELTGGRPGYGAPLTETGSAVQALAFVGGRLLGGDLAGALRQWTWPDASDAGARPLAGSAITAVAALSATAAVVADDSFGGAMRVVPLDGGDAGATFATALWGVTTIEVAGAALYTAGHDYGTAAVERRDVGDPVAATDAWDTLAVAGWVRDVAVSPDGATLAVAGDGFLLTLAASDLAAGPTAQIAISSGRSVAFTGSGDHIAVAGDDRVGLWDRGLVAEVASAEVPGGVAIAIDPSGERLVVASSDGTLRALACR